MEGASAAASGIDPNRASASSQSRGVPGTPTPSPLAAPREPAGPRSRSQPPRPEAQAPDAPRNPSSHFSPEPHSHLRMAALARRAYVRLERLSTQKSRVPDQKSNRDRPRNPNLLAAL